MLIGAFAAGRAAYDHVMTNPLIASLTRAVEAAPEDVALRLHLAELLLAEGDGDAAVGHCAMALQRDPGNAQARALMGRALHGIPDAVVPSSEAVAPTPEGESPAEPAATPPAQPAASAAGSGFDWAAAESEVEGFAPEPMFVEGGTEEQPAVDAWDVERTTVRLADVGGMTEVKDRIITSFLAPMQNPELRKLYGKSLRGGILLYGPPGCGKTFIGRAIAGELGAHFIDVGLSDILDMYIGQSERNLHELFEVARRNAPVVIFLDEVDALGQKRSLTRHSAMRSTVNQLSVSYTHLTLPTSDLV